MGFGEELRLALLGGALDLPVLEVDQRIAAEDADRDAEFAALGVDLFDDAVLILEGTIAHFDDFANREADLWFDLILGTADLGENCVNLALSHRDRLGRTSVTLLGAGKSDDARRVLDEVPR